MEEKKTKEQQKIDLLTEQLDISQKLHHEEFLKVRRYEKALSALLNLACESEQDGMIDIITDSLLGHELMEKHEEDALEGATILAQYMKD